MPRGDRTGPRYAGPMTGRRAGYCVGYSVPGFSNPIPFGAGFGVGRGGGGRGYRNWYCATGLPGWVRFGGAYPPPVAQAQTQEAELGILRAQATALHTQLEEIERRINQLEGENRERD